MENKELTLGSLFDGSGGFPLGGILAGIKPVFSSEVEPFPIRVTTKRLPEMKHYGDVSQLNGGDLEPVDIITFGSPCFPAGTLVLTEKGYIPIEEVKVGMKVLTHLGRWKTITAAGSKTGETVVLRGNHYGLECTPNHPIYSCIENKIDADKEWVPAKDMDGRLWAVPNTAELLPASFLQGFAEFMNLTGQGTENFEFGSKAEAMTYRFYAEINGWTTSVDHKEDSYILNISKSGKRLADDLHTWYRVTSMTVTGKTATVYNLTVDEDNSYVADGIVVHNCQDMSIAGKRNGLEGERSGLFHQAIRIVKEMRKATDGKYPRYLVWENVPGAFSSNNGEDFRTVLEELVSIRQEGVSLPRPKEWTRAGEVMGDGFSIAWRVLDAVNWGVPQRRKRIYLVADLDGGRAGKILFESEGMSRYSAEGFKAWQEAARDPGAGAPLTGSCRTLCLNDQGGNRMDVTEGETTTLRAESHHPPIVLKKSEEALFENHAQDARYTGPLENGPSITARYGTGGNNQPLVVSPKTLKIRCGKEGGGKGALIQDNVSATLGCNNDQTLFQPKAYGICAKTSHSMMSDNPESGFYEASSARTLDNNGGNPTCNQGGMAVVAFEGNGTRPSHRGSGASDSGEMYTLNATEVHGVVYTASKASFFTTAHKDTADTLVATDYKDPPLINEGEYIVRRLTPTECARLQGFSDWWCSDLGTDDPSPEELEFWKEVFETHRRVVTHAKKPRTETQIRKWLKDPHTDSAEYKMWGNGVALPCVFFVLAGIAWADGCQM